MIKIRPRGNDAIGAGGGYLPGKARPEAVNSAVGIANNDGHRNRKHNDHEDVFDDRLAAFWVSSQV